MKPSVLTQNPIIIFSRVEEKEPTDISLQRNVELQHVFVDEGYEVKKLLDFGQLLCMPISVETLKSVRVVTE